MTQPYDISLVQQVHDEWYGDYHIMAHITRYGGLCVRTLAPVERSDTGEDGAVYIGSSITIARRHAQHLQAGGERPTSHLTYGEVDLGLVKTVYHAVNDGYRIQAFVNCYGELFVALFCQDRPDQIVWWGDNILAARAQVKLIQAMGANNREIG